ncbi:hypothetical protein IW492_14010 [Enterococcus sp. BWB1-3]|uniref:hypothetical protein n=1 Tax=unclassified Enterococcus TaxID=2608891 RepID=UPI001920A60A|nr:MULTISPECIES: hypothetical protein [unclassified Enterococcus]MBL1230347.1 hypothetical protein [Enterococcus sp. BWB1-3]MCB5951035.1 hypothetical protein [Enterococcus sp. BWT-B8]MCB5955135.1 hypothetical protein [Enterococcus sp. CWB-B31]
MHQVYVDIIVSAIIEQFFSEEHFYLEHLNIDKDQWENWKNGRGNLNNEDMQKVKSLFTDYEWMLTQKIMRQTVLFPEKRNIAVSEYKRLKTMIARKWMKSDVGRAELLPFNNSIQDDEGFINLKVSIAYGEWGFDDIITFRLPSKLQPQLEGSKVELLDWMDENLMETYVMD